MAKRALKNYTLYKLRFWLGYGVLGIIIATVLVVAALYVPGGLTAGEKQSALQSATMDITKPATLLIVDFPYHALQRLSIAVFGVHDFSIKLPSLIFGVLSIIGLILVLIKRFKQTVSILAAGIILVSAQFISLATTGTPSIMFVFWSVLLLFIAAYGVGKNGFKPWAIYAGGITATLALFTPFTIYLVLAFLVGALLHPHLRYIVRRSSKNALTTSTLVLAAGVAVLIYASISDISFLSHLIFNSASFSTQLLENLRIIGLQLFDFTSLSTATTGYLTPLFGFSVIMLSTLGAVILLRERHSVLSHMLFSWTTLLTPVILFNPGTLYLLIVPMAFFVAVGSSQILTYWYRLFPRNPYARVFALAPVSILFACVIVSGVIRFFYSYHYYAPLANQSYEDTALVEQSLAREPDALLLVTPGERAFYRLTLDANGHKHTLVTTKSITFGQQSEHIIATRDASSYLTRTPSQVIADSSFNRASDRLYIYKKTEK